MVKDVSESDRYGRLLRYVYLDDGTFVNARLVQDGYAVVATFPSDVRHQELFLELQREARESGRGLWGHETLTPTQEPLPTQAPLPISADGQGPCNCTGRDLDCRSFDTHNQAQACFLWCSPSYGDTFRLDGDNDGLACEAASLSSPGL